MRRQNSRVTTRGFSTGLPVPVDIESALNELGIQVASETDDRVFGYCPGHPSRMHRQERTPNKWSVDKETGQHLCWSCDFSGSFVSLVQEVLNVERDEAEEWVRSRSGGFARVRRYLSTAADRDEEEFVPPREWNESRMALFTAPPSGRCAQRRISSGAVNAYGVLWNEEKSSWILPIRDPEDFSFWGYQEKSNRFFMNQPGGVKKSLTLFGIDALEGDVAILLESPLDCLRLYSAGIKGGVASFGAKVSEEQMNLLFDRVKTVIVALDNDEAGLKMMAELKRKYLEHGRDIRFINYEGIEAKDIGEVTVTNSQIVQAIETALPIWRYRNVYWRTETVSEGGFQSYHNKRQGSSRSGLGNRKNRNLSSRNRGTKR